MSWLEKRYGHLESLWNRGSRRKKFWIYLCAYTVAFLAAFLIAYSPFLLDGKSFIWQSDGRTQHYPFLVYLGRSIRKWILNCLHGDFTVPMFDLSIGEGGDIIGLLHAHGDTDPLAVLFAVFTPAKYMEYVYGFLAIFRVYLAGLSFSFLCRYFQKPAAHTLIGSMVYCFSGYAILCSMRHPFFVTPMILLPLLVTGLDQVLRRRKPYLFIFTVFYAGLCGYYHLYMMTILLVLYALIRFFDLYHTNRVKQFFCAVGRSAGSYVLGIGLSALVFLPGIFNVLNSNRSGFSNFNGSYSLSWYRTRLLRFISPPGSWMDMAFAAIVLFAVVLLFCSKRKRTLKCVSAVTLLIYLTSVGGLVMNGFQYPSTRWTFGLALVMSFVVVDLLPDLLGLSTKNQWICVLTFCFYAVFVFSTSKTRNTNYVLVGTLFLALTLFVLSMPLGSSWKGAKRKTAITRNMPRHLRAALCLLLVICNVSINGLYKYASDQGNYSGEFKEIGYETERLEGAIERELEPYLLDNPEGRADSSSFTRNTAMVWRIPGMLIFSSVENKNVIGFWNSIENSGNNQAFKINSTGHQTIATTLLSGKYHVEAEGKESYVPYGYTLIEKTKKGNLIYENEYALPWGYTYDNTISYGNLDTMNGLQKQQTMLQAIALDGVDGKDTVETITLAEQDVPYEVKCSNCTWENGVLTVTKANATMKLTFDMPENVEGYLRLSKFDINDSGLSSFTLKVNCGDITRTSLASSNLHTWYYGRENYLFNLGYSEEVRTELTITFPSKGTFKLEDIELYALPMDNYVEQVEALRAEPMENIQWGTNSLTGTVDLSKDKVLCVSVPYSKGWSATVDGEKVEIQRGNYMFMAIPLTAGHHDVAFTYCSPGIKLGAVLSVVSAGIVVGMLIYDRKNAMKFAVASNRSPQKMR